MKVEDFAPRVGVRLTARAVRTRGGGRVGERVRRRGRPRVFLRHYTSTVTGAVPPAEIFWSASDSPFRHHRDDRRGRTPKDRDVPLKPGTTLDRLPAGWGGEAGVSMRRGFMTTFLPTPDGKVAPVEHGIVGK